MSKADHAIIATLDGGGKPDLSNLNADSALRLLRAVRQGQTSTTARRIA